MVRKRKALALLVAVGVALGVLGLLLPGSGPIAAQTTPSATRSLSPMSVAPGGEVVVTITTSSGVFGQVVETLPAGFSYVDGSSDLRASAVAVSGRDITFTLVGQTSFSYTVTASDVADSHTFSGVLKVIDVSAGTSTDYPIADSTIAVEAAGGPSATRSLSPMSVAPGGEVVVTITTSSGVFGQVVETLPAGFSYVDGSSDLRASAVAVSGRDITFTLVGQTSFSYTVTASDVADSHTFSGVLKVIDVSAGTSTDYPIADSTIAVEAAGGPSATRSLSPMSVAPGGEVVVTITTSSGVFGQVVETLPAGFSYVDGSSDLRASAVAVSGRDITFTLVGQTSFSYTVTASDVADSHTFSGVLKVIDVSAGTSTDYPIADST